MVGITAPLLAVSLLAVSPAGPAQAAGFGSNLVTFNVGSQPRGIALDATEHIVYVANKGSNSVSTINEATGVVTVNAVQLPAGSAPEGLAWDSNSDTVWVANNNGTVSVISGTTLIKTITISVNGSGGNPSRVAVDTADHLVFVGLWLGYIVSIPDNNATYPVTLVYSSHSTTHIQLGSYDPATGLLYASAWDTHEVYEITKSGTVAGTLSGDLGVAFNGVPSVPEVDPFASPGPNPNPNQAELFTGSAGQYIDAFGDIATPPGTGAWWVHQTTGSNITPADFATDNPAGMVYAAEGNSAGSSVVWAWTETGTGIGEVGIGSSPYSIIVDPAHGADGTNGTVFVTSTGSNTVTMFSAT